jgi:hypothetical protein
MQNPALPTQNEAWGFFGTLRGQTDQDEAWTLAAAAVEKATGACPEAVRAFLDNPEGRRFADDVMNGLASGDTLENAIRTATSRWMAWTIGRRMQNERGIPAGLPYLTGLVMAQEIMLAD